MGYQTILKPTASLVPEPSAVKKSPEGLQANEILGYS